MAAKNVAVILSMMALALLMSACGGSGSAVNSPAGNSNQAFQDWLANVAPSTPQQAVIDGLPSIPLDNGVQGHSASVAGDPVVTLGADHINAYNYEDVETAVRLTAPADGEGDNRPLAYAMYKIEGLAGLHPTIMDVENMPEFLDDYYYVGVADYTTMHWRFFGPYSMPEIEVDLRNQEHRFVSEAGNMYFLVVTHDGMSCLHSQTTVFFGDGGEPRLPGAPSGLQASDGEIPDGVGLVWTPGPGSGWFEIFRKVAGDGHNGVPEGDWQSIGDSLEPHYFDQSAEPGVVYAYKVRAHNESGASGFSNVDTGFAGEQPPPPEGFRIHGWVRTQGVEGQVGDPVANVEVKLFGLGQPQTTHTGIDGSYSFDFLPQGKYLVVPQHPEMGFDPVYGKTMLGPDHPVAEINFIAALHELPSGRIWGFIWTFDGNDPAGPMVFRPMAGVAVSIDPHNPDREPFTVLTNEDGFYAAYEQPVGTYLVTPGADFYRFEPVMHDVNVDHVHVTPMLNFVGVPDGGGGGDLCVIEGVITNPDGGPLGEINVKLIPFNNPDGAGTFTNMDGHYRFGELAPGKYIVVPNNPHRRFEPKYQVVVVEPGMVARADFIGVETDAIFRLWGFTFTMQADAGNHFAPIQGALVQGHLDGHDQNFTAETNQDGYWEITELAVGMYIVSAFKDGFQFDPGSAVQEVNGQTLAPPMFFQGFHVP